MNLSKKNSLFIGISLVLFILLAVFYANPILTGKELIQPDIVHYRGGAQEMLEYRAKNGSETYWSDAMFGGMPTYQTGAQFRGDIIKKVDDVLNFLPKPANYLFLLFSGFFFFRNGCITQLEVRIIRCYLLWTIYLFLYYYCRRAQRESSYYCLFCSFAGLCSSGLYPKKLFLGICCHNPVYGIADYGKSPTDDVLSIHWIWFLFFFRNYFVRFLKQKIISISLFLQLL